MILVTGSAGKIGQAVVAELQARQCPVRGFDRVPTPGLKDAVVGSITNPDDVRSAMDGVEVLIHLAATPDDDLFVERLVPNNIIGVYHVFEAAREAGVRRMIVASSGQVVWGSRLTGPWPLGEHATPTPRYWYAATKLFLEGAGRAFADRYGISVAAVRLGWCPRTPEQVQEIAQLEWAQDVYLSPEDAGRFFADAATAKTEFTFAIVYATSIPKKIARYDLSLAQKLFGYVPTQTWPEGIETVVGATPPTG
ncbi:MAG: NAD-dependent epimerase [Gemmatales bacterium]|nr:MAG: NAD-dependent epimerase [Gemmatales bacterium]